MGCDIHGRLQYRYTENQKWQDGGEIETGRNYNLFAALADVRNYDDAITPISQPRGLPDDVFNLAYDWDRKHYEDGMFGDHSFSWLSLKELIEWDGWNQTFLTTGVVDRAEYEACLAENRTPNEWSRMVGGRDVIIVSPEDIARGAINYTYVQFSWPEKLRDRCLLFTKWLDYVATKYDSDYMEARIVFGFDS